MVASTLEQVAPLPADDLIEVHLQDFSGFQRLRLNRIKKSTQVSELIGMSRASFQLPPEVEWQLRDSRTSRLLRQDQPVGDVAREGLADLTLQPDVRLGAN